VAGTIAASGNNQIRASSASMPEPKYMALKVSLDGLSISSSATIAAVPIRRDDETAWRQYRRVECLVTEAIAASTADQPGSGAAGDAGIVLCAAAGNEGFDNDNPTANAPATYPASYRLPNMIVVAASDQHDTLASFSTYGATTVDLAAPGSEHPVHQDFYRYPGRNTAYHSNPFTYTGFTAGLTANLVDCQYGAVGDFPPAVNGNIAFIKRGPIGPNAIFLRQSAQCKAAGAVAVVINYNHSPGPISGTLQAAGSWLPALAISQVDGEALKAGHYQCPQHLFQRVSTSFFKERPWRHRM